MLNFERLLKLKIIALAVAVALFFESAVYGMDLSRARHLRVQITDEKGMKRVCYAKEQWEAIKKGIEQEEYKFTIRIRILTGVVYFTLFNLFTEGYFRVGCILVAILFYPILLFIFSLAKVKGHISSVEEYIMPLPPGAIESRFQVPYRIKRIYTESSL